MGNALITAFCNTLYELVHGGAGTSRGVNWPCVYTRSSIAKVAACW